jgi:hypothetical protein
MKKIKITTNYGKVHDFIMNAHINFVLWFYGIFDDEEVATYIAGKIINKYYNN